MDKLIDNLSIGDMGIWGTLIHYFSFGNSVIAVTIPLLLSLGALLYTGLVQRGQTPWMV